MESLRIRVEQALLGSVLSDPAGQQQALDFVDVSDMSRPWHGQVLQAMCRVRARGALPGPLLVYAELRQDPDLPPTVSRDAVRVFSLVEVAPRPGNADAYAVMVVEGGIRERLALAGTRLAQVAESGDLGAVHEQAARTRRDVAACRSRWQALPESLRRELPRPTGVMHDDAAALRHAAAARADIAQLRRDLDAGSSTGVQQRIASIAREVAASIAASARHHQQQAGERAPVVHEHENPAVGEAEVAALRNLVAAPTQLAEVRGWLRPHHFARPQHRDLYALLNDMDMAGKPVDPLTVAWETSRRGAGIEMADLSGGTGAFAVASARDVHRHGVLAEARQAGHGIQADAANPAHSADQLIRSAGERLKPLEAEARPESQPTRAAAIVVMQRRAAIAPGPETPGQEAAQ
jgi:replicative DNA helicase